MISVIIIIYFIITCACICVCKEITSWPGSGRDGDAPENLDSFLSQVFHSDTIIFLSSTQQLTNVHGVRTVAVANQTRVELSSRAVFLWCDTRPEEVVRQFGQMFGDWHGPERSVNYILVCYLVESHPASHQWIFSVFIYVLSQGGWGRVHLFIVYIYS